MDMKEDKAGLAGREAWGREFSRPSSFFYVEKGAPAMGTPFDLRYYPAGSLPRAGTASPCPAPNRGPNPAAQERDSLL